MEQIVKIFVHQSYFIENDLVVDYNVVQGARVNVSPKDWIALIPKGWSGVDEQVAFKTVDIDSDVVNLAIKSVTIEKKYFEKVVECEKQYQLMYVSQYLEILGRSEYFAFVHRSDKCDCVCSTKTDGKNNVKQNRLSSTVVFSRKPPRRQSPTPRDFYKNQIHSQNNAVVKSTGGGGGETSSKTSSKQRRLTCGKCDAPTDFAALESANLAKIQDLTIHKEVMEKCLLKVEKDLIHTLDVINREFKLVNEISRQKDDVQKFIDDIVDGIVKDGKITFWAHDQEFSVVREFPDTTKPDDEPLPFDSPNLSSEAHMKAIIGDQERTIQNLVNKIRDSFDLFFQENTSAGQHDNRYSVPTLSEEQPPPSNSIGYMDSSGTTYFSPRPFIPANTLLDDMNNLYLPENDNRVDENVDTKAANVGDWINDIGFAYKRPDAFEPKRMAAFDAEVKDEILAFEGCKKDDKDYALFAPSLDSCPVEKPNGLNFDQNKNDLDESN